MNIKDIIKEGEFIRVITDNKDKTEFVYPKDKFNNLASLSKEMDKHVALKVKKAKVSNCDKLLAEFELVKLKKHIAEVGLNA